MSATAVDLPIHHCTTQPHDPLHPLASSPNTAEPPQPPQPPPATTLHQMSDICQTSTTQPVPPCRKQGPIHTCIQSIHHCYFILYRPVLIVQILPSLTYPTHAYFLPHTSQPYHPLNTSVTHLLSLSTQHRNPTNERPPQANKQHDTFLQAPQYRYSHQNPLLSPTC
jgi:hypothetical protein